VVGGGCGEDFWVEEGGGGGGCRGVGCLEGLDGEDCYLFRRCDYM